MREEKSYRPRTAFKKEAGLTLVELVCVITLLGLIALLAVPAAAGINRGRSLEIAARGMAIEIRKTQQRAITSGWTQSIEMRFAVNDYRITDGKTGERYIVKLPEGVRYNSTNFPSGSGYPLLSFNRTGAPNRGGTVSLIDNSGKLIYIIVTPATGRVRISDNPPAN